MSRNRVEPLLALASQAAGWHLSVDLNVTAFVERRAISATFSLSPKLLAFRGLHSQTRGEKNLRCLLRHRFDLPTAKHTGTVLRQD